MRSESTQGRRGGRRKPQGERARAFRIHWPALSARGRLWLFRGITVAVVPIALLVVMEAGLRLAGYGYPASALVGCRVGDRPSVCSNPKFSWRFFPPRIARTATPFVFPRDKPPGTFRIFVLGSSAAMGVPEPAYSFSRILDVMLAEAWPGTKFEVHNTAITAINSHVVAEVAKDCARYQPDLFIVYMGNNEVTGPFGPGTVFSPYAANLTLIRLGIRLRATRLGQLLTATAASVAGGERQHMWKGMEMFLDSRISADDPRMAQVYEHFRANLQSIQAAAAGSGAAVLFCSVSSNLKDCPPFASLHRPGLSPEPLEQWRQAYERGVAAERMGQWQPAVDAYLAAEYIDSAFAELHFRLGRCQGALNQWQAARDRFHRARDLDALRFRADTQINKAIRETAQGRAAQGVHWLDAAALFEKASQHGCPGFDLFHEHVHLNFDGNYLLAWLIFDALRDILPARVTAGSAYKVAPLDEQVCARRLAYTVWDRYTITRDVLKKFAVEPPFTNQACHDDWIKSLEGQVAEYRQQITPETLRNAQRCYAAALEARPEDQVLRFRYAQLLTKVLNDRAGAAEQYRLIVQQNPLDFLSYAELGGELLLLKQPQESLKSSRRAFEILPACGIAHSNLGAALAQLNDTEAAKKALRQGLYWSPNDAAACINLADILVREHQLDEAITLYRDTLRYAPDDAALHCRLGLVLGMQGKRPEAVQEIERAANLDPNNQEIRNVLRTVTHN